MTHSSLRRYGPDVGLLCASLVAGASLGRLIGGGVRGPAIGPLVAAAGAGSVVPALIALKRIPVPVRAFAGTLAVMLVCLWATVPGSTTFGAPTAHTWHVLALRLQAARPVLVDFTIPLRPIEGVVLLGALTAGMVSVLGSVALRSSDDPDRLYPGLALLCPFSLLAFACVRTTSPSIALPVALFVAASAFTLSTAQPEPVHAQRGEPHSRRFSTATAVTTSIMVGVTLVALSVGSGAGLAGGSSGAGAAGLVPPTDLSLTSNLVALEVHDANEVLFRARTPYPTYWQVAVLNILRNGVWVPDPNTRAAIDGSAPAVAVQAGSSTPVPVADTFSATVAIENLSSRLLPVPPATVSLTGAPAATITGLGAESSKPTTSGDRYTTVSAVPVNDPGAVAGGSSVAAYPPGFLRSETVLPPLPSSVALLARAATVGAQTPLGQAEALVNWFRSGRFSYTLNPPAPAPGSNPLIGFLTQTRSGTCEQFAGAFTVLARSLGLPTRLVVGFTAGHHAGPDEVTVKGDDAHAWPQVYLGPAAGWVSFEPTPQRLTGELAPEGVVGPTGIETVPPPPAVTPSSTTPPSPTTAAPTTAAPATAAPTTAAPTVTSSPKGATGSASSPAGSSAGVSGTEWALIGVAGAIVIALGLFVMRRRRRWSPAGRTPAELCVLAEAEVDRALRRAGAERPRWQPLRMYVEGLIDRVGTVHASSRGGDSVSDDRLASLLADGARVAQVAECALFDPLPVSEGSCRAAYDTAIRLRHDLAGHDVRAALARVAVSDVKSVDRVEVTIASPR